MGKGRGKQGGGKKRRYARRRPRLVTPEGDPLVFAHVVFEHDAPDEIRRRLGDAEDFEWDEAPHAGGADTDEVWQGTWVETEPGPGRAPLGQRVLATLTLTPTTLKVETVSRRRRHACRRRLEALLGDRIRLAGTETKRMEEVVREAPARPLPEPMELPPEVIGELEERMIRQWLDESIPALGGLTPREAAKTPEGRRRLEALFDYMDREQAGRELPPGMFSPDYRKAKQMLGLK